MNINLPKEIKKRIYKTLAKRVLLFSFLELFVVYIIVKYENFFELKPLAVRYILYALLLILPILITKLHKYTHSSYHATVTDIKIKTSVEANKKHPLLTPGARLFYNNAMILTVKTDKGEEKSIKYKDYPKRYYKHASLLDVEELDIHHDLQHFTIGSDVWKIWGLDTYFVKLKDKNMSNCVVCECLNPQNEEKCIHCDSPLIKTDTIQETP